MASYRRRTATKTTYGLPPLDITAINYGDNRRHCEPSKYAGRREIENQEQMNGQDYGVASEVASECGVRGEGHSRKETGKTQNQGHREGEKRAKDKGETLFASESERQCMPVNDGRILQEERKRRRRKERTKINVSIIRRQ